MDKEQWQDEVLASVHGLQRAEPSPFLFTRIQQRLREEPTLALIPKAKIRLAAIGFALLCGLNLWAMLSSSEQPSTEQSRASAPDIFPYQMY
jgi:hypothetical protein